MPRPSIDVNKEREIIDLYTNKNLGKKKIAKQLKVSVGTITKVLNKNKIEAKSSGGKAGVGRPYSGGRIARHPLYSKWSSIKQRCYNLKNKDYKNYGGRGIKMYSDWINNFESFRLYIEINIGKKEEGYTLDRIDNNGNYEPGNLRWASCKQQTRNRRVTNCNSDLAKELRDSHFLVRSTNDKSVRQLAKENDIDYSHAKAISRGESWT